MKHVRNTRTMTTTSTLVLIAVLAIAAAPLFADGGTPVYSYQMGVAGRSYNFSDVKINSGSNLATVNPGSKVNLTFSFSVTTPSDSYCPDCITQLYVGIQGTDVECVSSTVFPPGTSKPKSVSISFDAPTYHSTYFVGVGSTAMDACVTGKVPEHANQSIAVVEVKS